MNPRPDCPECWGTGSWKGMGGRLCSRCVTTPPSPTKVDWPGTFYSDAPTDRIFYRCKCHRAAYNMSDQDYLRKQKKGCVLCGAALPMPGDFKP